MAISIRDIPLYVAPRCSPLRLQYNPFFCGMCEWLPALRLGSQQNTQRSSVMFKRILIANRGEIAVRIIRACREMGIESVAVYSDVDRQVAPRPQGRLLRVLGPADGQRVLPQHSQNSRSRAPQRGAEAIHPGYGFLSENAELRPRLPRGRNQLHRPFARSRWR